MDQTTSSFFKQCLGNLAHTFRRGYLIIFSDIFYFCSILAILSGFAWIGVDDRDTEGVSTFTDGTPLDFVNWAGNDVHKLMDSVI